MDNRIWMLANLTDSQLKLVREAEQTLGPINVLVFRPADLQVAGLDESQVECLHGLEEKLGMMAVAYTKA